MPPEPRAAASELLFRLLDAYERSSCFGRPAPWPRDMLVRLDAKTFPDAFAPEGRAELEALRAAAEGLVRARAARCERGKGGLRDTSIHALRLGPDELERAYALAQEHGYERLGAAFARLAEFVTDLRPQAGGTFMAAYLDELGRALATFQVEPLGMRAERLKRELGEVCDALRAACAIARGEVGWERMLSERLFRDTKRLGAIRARVIGILTRADPRFVDGASEDEELDVLAVYGMRRRPGFIVCAGSGVMRIEGECVRLQSFVPCAMIPEAWTQAWVEAVAGTGLHTATTIENEYSFHAYVEEAGGPPGLAGRGELALYTAGFPARFLADALRALASAAPHLTFRHWGDADAGGVRIWLHLRSVLGRPLVLYRTTSAWLRSLDPASASLLTPQDRARLAGCRRSLLALLESGAEDAQAALALVDAMLERGIKVEQERL